MKLNNKIDVSLPKGSTCLPYTDTFLELICHTYFQNVPKNGLLLFDFEKAFDSDLIPLILKVGTLPSIFCPFMEEIWFTHHTCAILNSFFP